MGLEVGFIMLPLIIFYSTPGSGLRNNFEPHKHYISPLTRTLKNRRKNEDFGLWSKYFKIERR